MLDSRYRDYRFTIHDVVADNASAGRYVVGTPVPAAGIDLRLVGVVLEHNGEVVATASAARRRWVTRRRPSPGWYRALAAHGQGLRAGEVILSGGLTAAVPLVAGDCLVVSIDRLGSCRAGLVPEPVTTRVALPALRRTDGRAAFEHDGATVCRLHRRRRGRWWSTATARTRVARWPKD